MKILSWNLNHRVQLKKIPKDVLSVIEILDPDIITLNEYVDGEERASFKCGLNERGYHHISVSQKMNRQNQVLIASKTLHEIGDLSPPSYDNASVTNFLHVVIPAFAIEVVGFRAPAYKRVQELECYWSAMMSIFKSVAARSIIFTGDFNCDPDIRKTPGVRSLNILCEEGWKLPMPNGLWSYVSPNGQKHSRLDYLLGSPETGNISGEYISEVDSCIIAGTNEQNPISDHAILLSETGTNISPY